MNSPQPFPRQPEEAVILAAHGSRREERANAIVREHARRLGEEHGLKRVQAAFWQGRPHFSEVLDAVPARSYTVVPLMSAEGYYAGRVLPRELKRNRRYNPERVHVTRPLGLHGGLPALAERRLEELLGDYRLAAAATSVIIVGHGTKRHAQSRASTDGLVKALRGSRRFKQVLSAFLDEPPAIDEAFSRVQGEAALILPFLVGGTYHAVRDIPAALGLDDSPNAPFPRLAILGERLVIVDRALGEDPGITTLLADLAGSSPLCASATPREIPPRAERRQHA